MEEIDVSRQQTVEPTNPLDLPPPPYALYKTHVLLESGGPPSIPSQTINYDKGKCTLVCIKCLTFFLTLLLVLSIVYFIVRIAMFYV